MWGILLMTRIPPGRLAAFTAALLIAAFGLRVRAIPDQKPTFRAGVDLVAVDVQVVDGNGNPILGLASKDFEVTIDGRRRQVESVQFLRYASANGRRPGAGPQARNEWPLPVDTGPGRTFVITIDAGSFQPGETIGVIRAAQSFVDRISPVDKVGVFTVPYGPSLKPTSDRMAVRNALSHIVGTQEYDSRFKLTPAEAMDIVADGEMNNPALMLAPGASATTVQTPDSALRQVQSRECRANDRACTQKILMEADALSRQFDDQAARSLGGLTSLLGHLTEWPGRKTVVFLSGGMPVSDRQGSNWHGDDGEGAALGPRQRLPPPVCRAADFIDDVTRA
jgi:VWFA-related protein